MSRTIVPIGERAGSLTARSCGMDGPAPGTPVAVANVDAHVSVPAVDGHRARAAWSRSWARASAIWSWATARLSSRACAASLRTESFPACSASRPANRRWATSSPGSSTTPSHRIPRRGRAAGTRRPRGPGARGGAAAPGRVGPARSRLVEWQPLDPRRRRPDRASRRRHARDTRPGDLPRAHRGDRVWDADDRRVVRHRRRRDQRHRRLWRAARTEPAADADLRRCDGRELKIAASLQTPALGSAMFGAVAAGRSRAATTRSSRPRGAWPRIKDESYRPDPAHGRL